MGAGWRVVDDLAEVVVEVLASLQLEAAFAVADFLAPGAAVAEGFFGVVLIMTPQCFFSPLGVDGVEVGIIREIRTGNDGQFGEGVVEESANGFVRRSKDIEILSSHLAVKFIEGFVESEVDEGGHGFGIATPGDGDDSSNNSSLSCIGVFDVVWTFGTR